MKIAISFILIVLVAAPAMAAEKPDAPTLLKEAQSALSEGRKDEALRLATRAIEASPTNSEARFFRGRLHEANYSPALAVEDFSAAIKMTPGAAQLYYHRGGALFKAGKFNESISDFDRFAELVPQQEAHLWQRGIAHYYAGQFDAGRKQFDLHQSVNARDVENAVWHFLCVARLKGIEKARSSLIPIAGDGRVPMRQIHRLFAGNATANDVLEAAWSGDPSPARRGEQMFYAHLYLGLYYEVFGDEKQSRDYIKLAADQWKENGYMGEVARIHHELRQKKGGEKPSPSEKQKIPEKK